MTSREYITRVNKIPFDERVPIEQLRKPAKQWFKEKYKHNNQFVNEDTGQTIEISGNGIAHTIRDARDVFTIYSLDVLPEMIARMKQISHEDPKKKDDQGNPIRIERYETKVDVQGKAYTAHFVIKVFEIGGKNVRKMERLRYYNHYLEQGLTEV